jgi:hypothetical protein
VNDQAEGALAKLWEISTRKGMSPLVMNALGRSLRHLDGVRVAAQDDHRARYLKLALVELRASMGLMRNSGNAADRKQADGVAQLLSSLCALEAWADATLGAPSAHPTRPGHEAGGATAIDDTAVAGLIGRLGGWYRRRATALEDPAYRWLELQALDRGIAETVRALETLGDRPLRWVDEHPAGAGEPDHLGAFAVCIHLGDAARVAQALGYLEAMARPGGALAEATSVLSTAQRPLIDEPLRLLFDGSTDPLVRGALVPLLAERQQVNVDQLEALLERDEDPPAVAAAEVLAWLGGREQVLRLLEQRKGTRSLLRAHAGLFAALALGSPPALDEIRRRLDMGEASVRLIEALAIAGDESDVRRLLVVAARRGRLARQAALAAGHLGSAQIAASARALPQVPHLEEALACTFGSAIIPSGPGAQTGRLWSGRPWSVAQALSALSAAETPVRVRERLALEIAVRTGVRPPRLYRAEGAADAQARAAQAWQQQWPGAPPSVPPWAYYAVSATRRAV